MFTYSGSVTDSATGQPIPMATVSLETTGRTFAIATRSNGTFEITSNSPGINITISSVGYKTWTFPASEWQHNFELEQAPVNMEEVVITAKRRKANKFPVWLAFLPLLLLLKNKR